MRPPLFFLLRIDRPTALHHFPLGAGWLRFFLCRPRLYLIGVIVALSCCLNPNDTTNLYFNDKLNHKKIYGELSVLVCFVRIIYDWSVKCTVGERGTCIG